MGLLVLSFYVVAEEAGWMAEDRVRVPKGNLLPRQTEGYVTWMSVSAV